MFKGFIQFLKDLVNPPLLKMGKVNDQIKVRVTKDNEIYFDGRKYSVDLSWTKEKLEKKVLNLLKMISDSGYPIIIEKIFIEPQVAVGLWTEKTLNLEMFKKATYDSYGGIEISDFILNNTPYKLVIKKSFYYDTYQFIISGHPEGIVCTRDVPDALAL